MIALFKFVTAIRCSGAVMGCSAALGGIWVGVAGATAREVLNLLAFL